VQDAERSGYIRSEFTAEQITWIIINIITGITVLDQVEDRSFSKAELLQDSLRAVVLGVLSPLGLEVMKGSALLSGKAGLDSREEEA